MANIFKTKEVYKNISPTIRIDPLRTARGVYVTGPYRPPHYIDHTLTIVKLVTTQATVVKYTERSNHVNMYGDEPTYIPQYGDKLELGEGPDFGPAWLSWGVSTRFQVTRYSTATYDIPPSDYGPAWLSWKVATPFNVIHYYQTTRDVVPDYGPAWLSWAQTSEFNVIKHGRIYYDRLSGHTGLHIKSIDTQKATIVVSK